LSTGLSPGLATDEWNACLAELGGHLLQSWSWGAFKSQHGWTAERVSMPDCQPVCMAQILFRQKGPFSVAYIPRGPVIGTEDPEIIQQLFVRIDHACTKNRALFLVVEPDTPLPIALELRSNFRAGPKHFQPSRTVKVPVLDDDALLAQMHQKTRYSVRLAKRKGVAIDRYDGLVEDAASLFYELLTETANRNEFGIHNFDYYRSFLASFDRDSVLLIARVNGEPAACLIAAGFGSEAIYMYGGSSTKHRAYGAAFYLQFEAMRWARETGRTYYDLWGIPTTDPEPDDEPRDKVPATRGHDWRGLYRFKTGFGGKIIDYPETLERVYHPLAARLSKRFIGARA
jgi:lipid II:glycine glycyltransferase (peptidoglycan interpeptide bridge formation enzyme)